MQLVVGAIPETLTRVQVDRIAFLHIDMNAPEPEEAAVRHFWPLLASGGIMVFDDYGFEWFGDSRASADQLAQDLGFMVFASPTGQGVVVKTGQEIGLSATRPPAA